MLYTAQFRYPGADRLDITVKSGKGGKGEPFLPILNDNQWSMVMGYKNGTISEAQYTAMYMNILATKIDDLNWLAVEATIKDVTLICYCPANTFCHRILLARHLANNFSVDYKGEITYPWYKTT